ncbi:MAG: cell division protein FtsZ [Bacteroidales bacterium]|nr:cell division protein FtsZ [Bacteroidales bacterium]
MPEMLKFDSPKDQSSYIKVIGVGGGGCNAVTHMFKQGIQGVDFILCNTDIQALETSPIPNKVQLGTLGLGAGSIPSVGKEAALNHVDEIKEALQNQTKMLFITAGMGGGTGTGGAPVIAAIAKELDILTVGIVTIPFLFEGRKRRLQAEQGIIEMRKFVDTLLIISNDKLRQLFGNLTLTEAFSKADNILAIAARGIAEVITVPGQVNVDFQDVRTVMKDSGAAIMGTGIAEGENRAMEAVDAALTSPLLNDNNIKGASNILLYISSGEEEIKMDEVSEITEHIQNEAGNNAEMIWGNGVDASLNKKISITIIATGFTSAERLDDSSKSERIVHTIDEPGLTPEMPEEKNKIELINEITLVRKDHKNTPSNAKNDSTQTIRNEPIEFNFQSEVNENQIPFIEDFANHGPDELRDNPEDTDIFFVKKETSILSTQGVINIEGDENDEIDKRSNERINKLKALSLKLKMPGGLKELENEPAYIRRNVKLVDSIPSEESQVAKYTLSSDDENNTEIKSNNSFLHDNVD